MLDVIVVGRRLLADPTSAEPRSILSEMHLTFSRLHEDKVNSIALLRVLPALPPTSEPIIVLLHQEHER